MLEKKSLIFFSKESNPHKLKIFYVFLISFAFIILFVTFFIYLIILRSNLQNDFFVDDPIFWKIIEAFFKLYEFIIYTLVFPFSLWLAVKILKKLKIDKPRPRIEINGS